MMGLGRLGSIGSLGAVGGSVSPQIVLSETSIVESSLINSVVGTLSVTNGSAATWTFAITADPENKFAIANDDELIIDATLDYEADASHSVTIEATPDVGNAITRQFTITVVNEPATLSLVEGATTAATTADLSFFTTEGNGTLYWVITQSATQPTAAQIKAGLNDGGTAAVDDDTIAVVSAGAQADTTSALTNGQSYYLHAIHTDGGGDDSNIESSVQWTQGAVPIIGNQTVEFGRSTRDGAGGLHLVVTGGGADSFAIDTDDATNPGDWEFDANDRLVPTQNGGLAASYSLIVSATNDIGSDTATITINTVANALSILPDSTQLAAALAACTGGETIYVRPGTLASRPQLLSYGSGNNGKPTYSDHVTIRSHDTNDKAWLYGFDFVGVEHVRLQDLTLGRSITLGGSTGTASVDFRTTGTHPDSNFNEVLSCNFVSSADDVAEQTKHLSFRGTSAAVKSDQMKCNNNTFQGGNANAFSASYVSNCEVIGNIIAHPCTDSIFIGNFAGMAIGFNYADQFADDGDPDSHLDFIQIGVGSQSGDYTDLKLFCNVSDAVGADDQTQNIFVDDIFHSGDYFLDGFSIVGNLSRCTTGLFIWLKAVKNGIIAGNTGVHPVDGTLYTSPRIMIESIAADEENPGGARTWLPSNSENIEILYNVTQIINIADVGNTNVTESDNITLTAQDVTAYNAAFDDPDHADIYTALATKAAGTLDTSPIKTGADATYFDYDNQKVDYPVVNIVTFTGPADVTDAAISSAITSAWTEITAVNKYWPESETSTNGALIRAYTGTVEFRTAEDGVGTNATAWASEIVGQEGEFVQYRLTTGSAYETAHVVVVKIGDQTDTWTVTTEAEASYTMSRVVFDGTTDYLSRNFNTGVSDTTGATMCGWFDFASGTDGSLLSLFDSTSRIKLHRNTSNKIFVEIRNTANTVIWAASSDTTYTDASGLIHVAVAFDGGGSPQGQIYVNGSSVAFTNTTAPTSGTIDWQRNAVCAIGAASGGTAKFNGEMGDLWINNAFLDLSTNISDFISGGLPVDLGATGELPTGSQPIICFAGDADHWNAGNGKGSVTGWTVNGSVANA